MYTLRPAESGDFEALFAIYREGRQRSQERALGAWDAVDARRAFAALFREVDLQVVESRGATIGAMAVAWEADPVELVSLDVAPEARGRGWGTLLVRDLVRQARRRNRDVVVHLERTAAARRLFAHLGFERVAEDATTFVMRWSGTAAAREALRAAAHPWDDLGRAAPYLARHFEAPRALTSFVEFIVKRAELPEPLAVLEIGCGEGLRLAAWTKWAHTVTAYASQVAAAAAAAREAARLGDALRVVPGNALEFATSELFDVALLLEGELSRILSVADRRAALRNVRAALRPGGVLVVAGPNWPVIAARGVSPDPTTVVGPLATISRIPHYAFDFHEARVRVRRSDVVEIDGAEVAVVEHEEQQALLDRPNLVFALEEAGFVAIETFFDLASTAVGRAIGTQLLLVARVPLAQ